MAKFEISDFIHLGIDKGVEATRWRISLDEEGLKTIINVLQEKPDLIYEGDMRITEWIELDGTVRDLTNFNNGTGLYWNGESPIWVAVKIIMNGKESAWFKKRYEYIARGKDGVVLQHHNPLDFNNLEAYVRSSNKT